MGWYFKKTQPLAHFHDGDGHGPGQGALERVTGSLVNRAGCDIPGLVGSSALNAWLPSLAGAVFAGSVPPGSL